MKPVVTPPLAPFGNLTAELAQEARRHLAFSCYCTACENGAQKQWAFATPTPAPTTSK